MRNFLLMMICILSAQLAFAQADTKGSISLTVLSDKRLPLENATVSLFKKNTLYRTAVADSRGMISFDQLPADTFSINLTAAGFESQHISSVIVSAENPKIQLADIAFVQSKTTNLQAVTVTAKKPFIQKLSDRIVVNVDNSIISTGSSAMDVLERSPGVNIDQNDAISLRGKSGVNIMIDGKPTPMSGAELAAYLKALPASSLERIDIITNPSSKYDASGNSGIIDIRMKKDQRLGTNGTFNASYGQGIYPKITTGASFNYRNKKVNIFGGYSYAYRKGLNHLFLDRSFYENGIYNGGDVKENFNRSPVKSQIPRLGMDFFPSKKTVFGFVVNASFNHFTRRNDNESLVLDDQKIMNSTFNSVSTNNDHNKNVVGNINYKHSFDKGKEFTADADYGVYNSASLNSNTTSYYKPDGTVLQPFYRLDGDQNGKLTLKTAKADYTDPIKEGEKVEAGVKTSFVTADNDAKFFDVSTGTPIVDAGKTNHFIYKENNNAAYLNYSKTYKKFDVQLGLRAEQTNISTEQKIGNVEYDSSYLQLFPSAFFNYKLKEDQTLGVSVSRRIDRPNYSQLNPFLFLIDPTTYATGAPGLLPQFTWSYELSYTLKTINFTANYSHSVNDQNVAVAKFRDVFPNIPSADNVTVQIPVNLKSSDNISLTVSAPIKIRSWWNMVNNVSAYYQKYTGSLGTTQLNKGKPSADLRSNNSFTFKKGWSAELNGSYSSGGQYGFMVSKSQWSLSAGVQKSIMKSKGTLRFNISDIFWKNLPAGVITYDNYFEKWHAERDTRVATLAFSYRFGSNKVQAARKRATASEEERQRAQ
jgi:iron complex outermembrane receptor protein